MIRSPCCTSESVFAARGANRQLFHARNRPRPTISPRWCDTIRPATTATGRFIGVAMSRECDFWPVLAQLPGFAKRLRFDLPHDLRDALFFLEDVVGELLGRQVFEVGGGVGVFEVEVAAFTSDVSSIACGHLPGAFVLLALFHHVRQPANSSNCIGWVLV